MPTACSRCAITALLTLTASTLLGCASSSPDPHIDTVLAFQDARHAGDTELARTFTNSDPRMWYGDREGEGSPLGLTTGLGQYAEWDREFRSAGEILEWRAGPDWIAAIHSEMNDYFRLIERNGSWYERTWFFDDAGKITGSMISGWEDAPKSTDRFEEFEAWAKANRPEEWEYLRPGGSLDPTGDRARRTRVLLDQWRKVVDLPPLE